MRNEQDQCKPVGTGTFQIGSAIRPYIEASRQIQQSLQGIGRVVAEVARAAAIIRENFGPTLAIVGDAIRQFPAKFQNALMGLAKEGWYIDPEWPIGWVFSVHGKLSDDSGKEEARAWLMDYFSQNIDAIETRLRARHPKHAHILAKAFSAHRRGDYELSIPVLLIQAEAICKVEHGHDLFGQKGREGLKGMGLGDRLSATPLLETTPLNASTKDRAPSFVGLNRHLVVHGEDLSYGTLENSLKAISWITFSSSVLKKIKEEEGSEPEEEPQCAQA